jgi:hypothetical protein
MDAGFDEPAVVWMDSFNKRVRSEDFLLTMAQDFPCVIATLSNAGVDMPIECCHSTGFKRALQSRLTLGELGRMFTPFGKKRRQN